MHFLTIDDFEVDGKTILVRTDLNSGLDENKEPKDNIRIKYHSGTIKELSDKGAKVVVMTHQGRVNSRDFICLEKHAKLLENHTEKDVKYIDDIFGSYAKNTIKSMKKGDIVLLENVRFSAEETSVDKDSHLSHMVKQLAPILDYYVNDSFAANHRNHVSLVGFPQVLPSFAGRILQKELDVLTKVLDNPKRPSVLCLGGAKVDDSIKVIEQMLFNNSTDRVLTTGLVAMVFLAANGDYIGNATHKVLVEKKADLEIKYAKKLLKKYRDKIIMPVDFAVEVEGRRVEIPFSALPSDYPLLDIGQDTIELYKNIIHNAATVLCNGPAGVFEKEGFETGTVELFRAMEKSKAFSVLGGGDSAIAAERLGMLDKIDHVSTGGGAFILFISGKNLPAVDALINSAKKYGSLITRVTNDT
ncbi:MAG: phosphoglycerate kinase [Candidatus Nanohalarchaeota archaeon]|nr:MAG: phosphoglycerate kinase [Candidatus Nanohaloarchaeota archaeon]